MTTIYRSVIQKFLDEHSDIRNQNLERCLYSRCDCEEKFVFECREWNGNKKTFVFVYDCGNFAECYTEYNTFGKYLLIAPWCDFMEVVRP